MEGLVDNTPLGDAIDAFSPGENVDRVLVIMNLFPSEAVRPSSLLEVNERINQLRFGNRTQQDKKTASRINELVATIESLAALLPGELPPEVAAAGRGGAPIQICEHGRDLAAAERGAGPLWLSRFLK